MDNQPAKNNELRRGLVVFIVLAILTAIEFYLGKTHAPAASLVLVALIKAAAVIWYFMHIRRLFKPSEGDHS